MKKNFALISLLYVIFTSMSFADQLLDKSVSSEERPSNEIGALLDQAVKDKREDCIKALLANANFNIRGIAQRFVTPLTPSDQIVVLRSVLKSEEAWIEPKKNGEEIVSFEATIERYTDLLKGLGIHVPKEQLMSKNGRDDLLRLLNDLKGSKLGAEPRLAEQRASSVALPSVQQEPLHQQNSTPVMQPKSAASPTPTAEETQSSRSSSIVSLAIVVALIVGIILYFFRRK